MKIKDIKEGVKVGSLTAIRPWGLNKGRDKRWLFRCDCGNYKPAMVYSIGKHTSSCGHCGTHVDDFPDHQKGSIYRSLYNSWSGMKRRCYNINNPKYLNYGSRGIEVCDEWRFSYSAFKKWALNNGWKPNLKQADQSLDRIDVNGNYEPDNCRWVDMKTQVRNRRNTRKAIFHGESVSLAELSEKYHISMETIQSRIEAGKQNDALIVPPPENNIKHLFHGELLTIKEIAEKCNVTINTVRGRIYRGTIQELFDKEER